MTGGEPGLIAIYRWRVTPDQIAAFVAGWEKSTARLRLLGSHGSTLAEEAPGVFVAVALWPDAATRDAALAELAKEADPPLQGVERDPPFSARIVSNRWRLTR